MNAVAGVEIESAECLPAPKLKMLSVGGLQDAGNFGMLLNDTVSKRGSSRVCNDKRQTRHGDHRSSYRHFQVTVKESEE